MANTAAEPLAVNNRVVLHLLNSLQRLRMKVPGGGPAETRRVSFRALDVEQIGHVYEGLLDHTAVRANERCSASKAREQRTGNPALHAGIIVWPRAGQAHRVSQGRNRPLRFGPAQRWKKTACSTSTNCSLPAVRTRTCSSVSAPSPVSSARILRASVVVLPGSVYVTAGTTGAAPARTTHRHPSPNPLSSTRWSRWSMKVRPRAGRASNGSSNRPKPSSTSKSATWPWVRAPSLCKPAAIWPSDLSKPGKTEKSSILAKC